MPEVGLLAALHLLKDGGARLRVKSRQVQRCGKARCAMIQIP